MIRLVVHVTLPDNTTLRCGETVATESDPRGRVQDTFHVEPIEAATLE